MTLKQTLNSLQAPDGSYYVTLTDGVGNLVTAGGGGGGSGTVTSVSVTTANGVSGTVATATTTPAISLTLGAITPTSVNGNTFTTGTYTLTGTAGKTLTFSNTLTLSGTDSSTLNIGAGGTLGTAAYQNTGTSGANLPFLNGTNTWSGTQTFGNIVLGSSNTVAWSTDVFLARMAAGTLGHVNLANAQTLQIYATSDVNTGAPTNYERISITKAIGGAATIDVQNGGTGAAATAIVFKLAGSTKFDYGATTAGTFTVSGSLAASSNIQVATTGAYSFGSTRSSLLSPSDGVIELIDSSFASFNRLQFGGTTASFGAIARDGAGIKIVGADGTSVSWIKVPGVVVASLPSAATAGVGAISFVTDANTTVILGLGATVVGGGANKVPVYSDGTNWIVG